jgi:hypothetical protein
MKRKAVTKQALESLPILQSKHIVALQQQVDFLEKELDKLAFLHDCGRMETALLSGFVQQLLDASGSDINVEEEMQEMLIDHVVEARQEGGAA